MLSEIAQIMIDRIRQRVSDGDRPVAPAEGVEAMEDLILSLDAENSRLRDALKPVAEAADNLEAIASQERLHPSSYKTVVPYEVLAAARAALPHANSTTPSGQAAEITKIRSACEQLDCPYPDCSCGANS